MAAAVSFIEGINNEKNYEPLEIETESLLYIELWKFKNKAVGLSSKKVSGN
ncbi:hypothetical protein NV377_17515 [Paenibacillus sp. T3-5-0-4]|nr:hypothetical protein [Paenibacillus endoradicis]